MAVSNVMKEVSMKSYRLNTWYTNAHIGLWQCIFGFCCFWTLRLKAFASPIVPWDDIPGYIGNAKP
eukprot:UN34373